MALDIHATVTSMVAHQHLASHSTRSDDASAAHASAIRSATKNADGTDSVDISHTASSASQPVVFSSAEQAGHAAQLLSAQIIASPTLSLQAQGNSVPAQVFALVQ